MYDLIDRPVDDLPSFEKTVLQRMRRWVHALTTIGSAPAGIGDDAFGAAMTTLDSGSVEEIELQRPCFSTVTESEAILVALWRLVRADRLAAARATASRLVDEGSARTMLAAMIRADAALPA